MSIPTLLKSATLKLDLPGVLTELLNVISCSMVNTNTIKLLVRKIFLEDFSLLLSLLFFLSSLSNSNTHWILFHIPSYLWHSWTTHIAGVEAYIIDTGVLTTHNEFKSTTGSRAVWGINYAGDGVNQDCNGHGTHVAGTVGGNTYGLAKNVTIIAVKVLDCDGSGSVRTLATI